MKFIYLMLVIALLFTAIQSLHNADALTFPVNSSIDLKHSVRFNDGIVSNVLCNITVYDPNKTLIVNFRPMTDRTNFFNYTIPENQTTKKGLYTYDVTCTSGGINKTSSFDFLINLGGVEPSQQRTDSLSRTIYIIFGIGVLFFIAFLFMTNLPFKWTFLLLSFLFFLIAINTIFISLQDEVVNLKLENFFSAFTSISFIIYWFIGIALGIMWLLTFINTILYKNMLREAGKYE